MNKNRMILAVIGGVIGLAVLALAYLNWSAYSAKTAAMDGDEETEGLEAVVGKAQSLSRKPVYPCAASVSAINANATALADWENEALKLAVRGDKIFPKTTPAAFKTFIVEDARRLAALPGFVNGVIAKPDFTFGPFKDYIAEGKMPADAQLSEMQRKWDDVTVVVETLSQCGVAELVNLEIKTAEKKEEPQDAKSSRQKKSNKGAKAVASTVREPVAYTYVFSFTTRPAGFVKVVNALETCERFIVVDSFAFNRPVDSIGAALGADDKKDGAKATARRGRRGRGRAAVEEPKAEDEKSTAKNGIVTDPALDAPLAVTMTVTVYDFRSLEENEKKSEEEEK